MSPAGLDFIKYAPFSTRYLHFQPRKSKDGLESASLFDICKGLEAGGKLTGAGLSKWRPETVKKMLQNEKYVEDAMLQKTYTIDFLEKKRVINNEIVSQYYVENSHEAIISRDSHMLFKSGVEIEVEL